MSKYEVHVSDIRAFKTCRRQWYWSSPLGENLEPDKPYAPFFTGRIIHTALELYYRSGGKLGLYGATEVAVAIEREKMEAAGTLWEEEIELLDEQVSLCYGLMEHYEIWVESKEQSNSIWGDANLEYLDMETNFHVPMLTAEGRPSSRVFLGGRFDGIARRRDDGSLWLFESKTTRSIGELQKTLAYDEQAGAYIYAAQQLLGEQVYGVIYNIMRKKVPTKARVLNSGMLSQNKNIDTTLAYYWNQVQDHHPDYNRDELMDMYGDVLNMLHEKGNTFFSRTVIRRTEREISELSDNLRYVALEMVRPSTRLYPSPSWTSCTFCRFKGPCLAVNSGADYESMLDAEFRQRKDRVLRPYLLYGFHFVPIADDSVSVWYYNERVVVDVPDMNSAVADTLIWVDDQVRSDNGYVGPGMQDLLRGAKEIGLWQEE
jgi:hypothetical protein